MRTMLLTIILVLFACAAGRSYTDAIPSEESDILAILGCISKLNKEKSHLLAPNEDGLVSKFRDVRVNHFLVGKYKNINLIFGDFVNGLQKENRNLISDARGIECSVELKTNRLIKLLAPEKLGSRKLVNYVEPDQSALDSEYQGLKKLAKDGASVTLVERVYRYKNNHWVQVGKDNIQTKPLVDLL